MYEDASGGRSLTILNFREMVRQNPAHAFGGKRFCSGSQVANNLVETSTAGLIRYLAESNETLSAKPTNAFVGVTSNKRLTTHTLNKSRRK
jgi:hypothetical protein